MNLLLLSDLHLRPDTPERNQRFLSFLESAFASKDHLLLVGDLFDLWFGWKDLTFSYQADILFRMSNLAQDGLTVDYVEGNRDFGIEHYRGTLFRKVYARDCRLQWGKRHIYAEHGDLINRDDFPYRFFRKLSKNRLSYFMLDHLPARFLLRAASRLERKLKGTNLRYKNRYPEEQCRAFYNECFEKGADIVVVGHFHEERELEFKVDSRRVQFYNLPGWEKGFRYLVVPDSDEKPYFQDFL